ncbi:MAG TPA: transcriptional repressor [Firmicutes bacterium]|nr:transcriptional repressor [Bacillota bacterium]
MLEEQFRIYGLKVTENRLVIYRALEKEEYPCTAEELFKTIKDKNINLSTIYRTLNSFEKAKLVKREINQRKENVFSLQKNEDKHVLVCMKCHKRVPLEGCPFHTVNESIQKKTGFIVEDQNTEIYGLCPDCQKGGK